jgi:hypothetical protein
MLPSFANDDTHAVVNQDAFSNFCTRMNFNPRLGSERDGKLTGE